MPTRKHLFKAKRKDTGEWVEGDLVTYKNGDCYIFIEELTGVLYSYFVDPKTVCECTWRKDDNGTKVFEGDICKTKKGQIFLVAWSSPLLEFVWLIKRGDNSHLWNSGSLFTVCHFEVIGNIYDNPELLEVKA